MSNINSSTAAVGTPSAVDQATKTIASSSAIQATSSDIQNLFLHVGNVEATGLTYQEICSDTSAVTAVRRWPIFSEWLNLPQLEREL